MLMFVHISLCYAAAAAAAATTSQKIVQGA